MPSLLTVIACTPGHIATPAVQRFACGDAPWEREVSAWIKGGPDGVMDALAEGCQVWLYVTQSDGLVGYSSLAQTNWRYRTKKDPLGPLNIIPYLGIQSQFLGKPDGPREGRFSTQIMRHVIAEACKHQERQPLLALYVHPENTRAQAFYRQMGFAPFYMTYRDRETGIVHVSMIMNLPVATPPPE